MKFALLFAAFIFSLVAIAHLLRLIFQVEVLIGGVSIPMWVSIVGIVVPGVLALVLWREGSSKGP